MVDVPAQFSEFPPSTPTGSGFVSGMTSFGSDRMARYVLRVSVLKVSIERQCDALVDVRARRIKDFGVDVAAWCA